MTIDIETLELHDARLKGVVLNYELNCVRLSLEAYLRDSDKARCPIELSFDQVKFISNTVDMARMQANAFAGNINYWIVGTEDCPTYIYLTDGFIAISSLRPRVIDPKTE